MNGPVIVVDVSCEIPGYRLLKELGRGGMGVVYLAVESKLNREVALKIFDPRFGDPATAARFQNEAQTAAQLRHGNISPVFDVGVHGRVSYMTMEYLDGGNLKSRLCEGPMDRKSVRRVLGQMAAALGHAHAHGVVHRDVKPENILFRRDGAAVLTDFGIAKSTHSVQQLTAAGVSIGTPYYMSPEQIRGRELDGRADIYSLGIVLFEMLTGHVPFEAEDTIAVAMMHVKELLPPLPSGVGSFQDLLDGMTHKERDGRFHAADVLSYLGAEKGSGARMSFSGAVSTGPERSRRNDAETLSLPRSRALAIGVLATLAVALTGLLVFPLNRAPAIPDPPSLERMIRQALDLRAAGGFTVLGTTRENKRQVLVKIKDTSFSEPVHARIKFEKAASGGHGKWVVAEFLGPSGWISLQDALLRTNMAKAAGSASFLALLAGAIAEYINDHGEGPLRNESSPAGDERIVRALVPFYIKSVPGEDLWGNRILLCFGKSCIGRYGIADCSEEDYLVISHGRDGRPESWAFDRENGLLQMESFTNLSDFDRDLVAYNGRLVRGLILPNRDR